MRTTTLATAVVVIAAAASGCTGSTDKSGGETKPTTLLLASAEGTSVSAPGVTRFAQLVDELSDGRIQVEVSPDWQALSEQRVLEDVAVGRAALGWSGTRALDLIGVDEFRSLHAPFLVGSYPAQKAIVADGVAQEMLAGLEGSGLTGLALLADELRLPAGAEGPLLGPGDFEDLDFGIAPSNAQSAAMTALGANVTGVSNASSTGIYGLGGLETMWGVYFANGQQLVAPFVTGNVVLWPRTAVIVANSEAFDDLSSDDREIVTQAATDAANWSIEHAGDDVANDVAEVCGQGGVRIAIASPRQLTALRDAAEPVYSALRADPEQATLLARVEQLVGDADPADPVNVPEGCAYRPGDEDRLAVPVLPAVLSGPGQAGELPAGTYRYTLTEQEINQGVGMGDDFAAANAGVWTWTLADGRWSYELKLDGQAAPEGYGGTTCEGYYDVHGHQVDFTTVTVPVGGGDCASKTWKADWQETGDGLEMDVTTDSEDLDFLFGAKTWERID